MVYLRDFTFLSGDVENSMVLLDRRTCFNTYYPFGVLSSKGMRRVTFDPVTIFYGGNGSGKSTALNIIAAKLKLLREIPFSPTPFFEWTVNGFERSGTRINGVSYNSELPEEAKGIPAGSRILTSEDVFDKTLAVRGQNLDINQRREVAAGEWLECNFGKGPTKLKTINGPEYDTWSRQCSMRRKSMSKYIKDAIGYNVKTGSNGENAFDFFVEKLRPGALYLLDEPENSLSAKWQVKLAALLEGLARFENCQLVIATHSPFLLGIKGAKIYDLDSDGAPVRKWTDLENVREYSQFFQERASEFKPSAVN